MIEQYNPQLAILDIMMPSMTGLEVTQRLRKDDDADFDSLGEGTGSGQDPGTQHGRRRLYGETL